MPRATDTKAKKKTASKPTNELKPLAVTGLTGNPRNPRKPWKSDEQKSAFMQSLMTFGDLGGIVFNRKTKQLVGGHKRIEEFKNDENPTIEITHRFDTPTEDGTLAHGYVVLSNGVRFSYREVRWDKAKDSAANLAANKWSAEWDLPGVASLLEEAQAGGFELEVTGFELGEVDELIRIESGGGEDHSEDGDERTGAENIYTGKIDAPIYEPTGECPSVEELCDSSKASELIAEVEKARIPEEVRTFLTLAAARHRVFDYEKIAEYYAHAPKQIQRLMEKSALVIIDFESAIENGFVHLSERMKQLYLENDETATDDDNEDETEGQE